MLTFETGQSADGSWFARLHQRNIVGVGETEIAAMHELLNYTAQLIDAGCLDSTGVTKEEMDQARYRRVFPEAG
jgi:hypothetical protein